MKENFHVNSYTELTLQPSKELSESREEEKNEEIWNELNLEDTSNLDVFDSNPEDHAKKTFKVGQINTPTAYEEVCKEEFQEKVEVNDSEKELKIEMNMDEAVEGKDSFYDEVVKGALKKTEEQSSRKVKVIGKDSLDSEEVGAIFNEKNEIKKGKEISMEEMSEIW